jgi:hypothetical protein
LTTSRANRLLAAILAGALCAGPLVARADGISAQAEGGYANSSQTAKDTSTGQRSKSDGEVWSQRYRLGVDDTLAPLVQFRANGLLDWQMGSTLTDGVRTDTDSKTWDGNAHLTVGGPGLSAGVDYDRRQQSTESRTAGVKAESPSLIRDAWSGSGSWHPYELPTLDLRLARTHSYDSAGLALDNTADEVQLISRYDPLPSLDLRYTARYSTLDNRIGGVRSTDITNAGTATWSDRFLDGRASTYVSYGLTARNSDTSVTSASASLLTQRFPVAGLSLVEGPLDTPARVTLTPNAALIDGVLTASAGVNLGFNAAAAPPVTSRDLGAQLPNDVTRVSLLYVFVDKNVLPVADQFAWTAWASDDNVTWAQVPLAGAVTFDPLQFRFEIPIQPTTRRYLKVVTRPFTRGLTTDPQFADIFVTELQLLDVGSAAEIRGRSSNVSGTLNGTARVLLVRAASLSYDVAALLTHTDNPSLVTWSVANGLSAQRRLATTLSAAGRVDRTDSDAGKGHEGANRWAGTLTFDPLPTLGGTLAYSGQYAQHPVGYTLSHTGTAFAKADLYEGISTSATGSLGWSTDQTGRATTSETASMGASVVPNRALTTAVSGSISHSVQSGAGRPDQTDRRGVLEASASLSPYRTLSLSATVLRFFGTGGASTLVNFTGGVSLFPRGDLQLSYSYQEALDTGAQSRSRTHGPALRWNIRRGWYLTSNYTFQHTTTPAQTVDGQAFSVNLLLVFR